MPFQREKEFLFETTPKENNGEFFWPAQRAQIVDFILKRESFSSEGKTDDVTKIGIHKLISDGIYDAAYPLHEGKREERERERAVKTFY